MVEFTFQMILNSLQTIAVIIGIVYYITIMRNQNRSRQVQIIGSTLKMDLDYNFLNWDTSDYEVFMSKHGPKADPEGWKALNVWFNMLELQGVYVREGLLDVRLVCLMSGGTIKESWESYRGVWEEWRRRYDRPRDWIEAEYLYERVVEYMARHPELGI
jgi:hypothetical protein